MSNLAFSIVHFAVKDVSSVQDDEYWTLFWYFPCHLWPASFVYLRKSSMLPLPHRDIRSSGVPQSPTVLSSSHISIIIFELLFIRGEWYVSSKFTVFWCHLVFVRNTSWLSTKILMYGSQLTRCKASQLLPVISFHATPRKNVIRHIPNSVQIKQIGIKLRILKIGKLVFC